MEMECPVRRCATDQVETPTVPANIIEGSAGAEGLWVKVIIV